MRKRIAAVGALVVLLSVAACGTADPLNNGDSNASPGPTPAQTKRVEGDSHYYPHVGKTPTVSAKHRAKRHHKG